MDFQKEFNELVAVIEEVKKATNLPLEGDAIAELTVGDIEKLLEKTQGFVDQLNEKANAISDKLGMSREELNKFVSNPDHFKKEDWEVIQNMNSQIESFQKSLLKNLFNQKNELIVKKEIEAHKKRKLKATKQNWMPM